MGALGSAISGLQASQQWLDVISNNVSNSQTVAYKAGRVSFQDLVNQGLRSASGPDATANLGGIDPEQLGLGVSVGSIQTLMSQGAIQVTGQATDVAIQGSGFFSVKSGSENLYTRSGNFTFDDKGNLVTANGGLVQGWQTQFKTTTDPVTGRITTVLGNTLSTQDTSQIRSIQIPQDMIIAPKATGAVQQTSNKDQGVIISGNLDERTPPNAAASAAFVAAGFLNGATGIGTGTISQITGFGVDLNSIATLGADPFAGLTPDHTITETVYDSVGDPRSITYQFYQVGDTQNGVTPQPPQWAWYAFDTTTIKGSAVFTGQANQLTCIGGTGIDVWATVLNGQPNDPGIPDPYGLISFNADGSLQTNGGFEVGGAGGAQFNPILGITNSINPMAGTAIPSGVLSSSGLSAMEFSTNFGTPNTYAAGAQANGPFSGFAPNAVVSGGLRDGLTGDYGGGSVDPTTGIYIPNSTATATFQDGYTDGTLNGVSIDQTGKILGTFSNGQTIALAQLAMAGFTNPAGLAKVGDNYYATTDNSGQVRYSTAGQNGFGTTQGGALEASNVDLTVELTNMIVAQRMFEANSRVVTTEDSVLNTLTHLGQ
jgi:flagellar hook protein FlgE